LRVLVGCYEWLVSEGLAEERMPHCPGESWICNDADRLSKSVIESLSKVLLRTTNPAGDVRVMSFRSFRRQYSRPGRAGSSTRLEPREWACSCMKQMSILVSPPEWIPSNWRIWEPDEDRYACCRDSRGMAPELKMKSSCSSARYRLYDKKSSGGSLENSVTRLSRT